MHMTNLKRRICNQEYDVDPQIVAAALLQRLAEARQAARDRAVASPRGASITRD